MAVSDEPTRTVVVWCADWPAMAMERGDGRAVVVMRANRVVATNPLARALGVMAGMRRREAQRLCPRAELLDRDTEREARAYEPIVAALDDITPRIEITRPGSCLFPSRGPARYFGGDGPLAQEVARVVRGQLALPTAVGVGIADGAFGATLAARAAAELDGDAGAPGEPGAAPGDGTAPGVGPAIVVDVGETPQFLAPFPIDTLGRPELVEVLRRLGLTTLGSFGALPERDVLARFGSEGQRAQRLARGLDLRPPHLVDPPVDLDVVHEADPPIERVDQASFVAKMLADDLHERLGGRGLAAVAIIIEATTTDGQVIERRWRHDATLSSTAVAQRVRWQLDGWLTSTQGRRSRGAGALVRLRVRPTEVVADVGRQLGFWGGADAASIRARGGLARVQAVLGSDSVKVAEWKGGRAPGERYQLVPVDTVGVAADESFELAEPGPEPWPGSLPDPPPALVWSQPRPAEVVDDAGALVRIDRRGRRSGDPARLSIESGPWQPVVAWSGPWLVDERWWDAQGHRRRARFQVCTEAGAAHLVTLEAQRWWVEATYD
ncbi:MAG: DNA polymerase Y family protein [Microthrixaceae bacterium]|nr:DNA polymerase Y family protein [Microthrixaceae bacterium]